MIENSQNRTIQHEQAISSSQGEGAYPGAPGSDVGGARADQDFQDDRTGQAKAAAAKIVEDEKGAVARQLRGLAGAIEKVGSELRQSDQPGLGRYTQDLGKSIGRLARECEDRDVGEIAAVAESFGRKQPLAFLGMAAIAGLAASRFLTASAKRTTAKTPHASSARRADDAWAFEKDSPDA